MKVYNGQKGEMTTLKDVFYLMKKEEIDIRQKERAARILLIDKY